MGSQCYRARWLVPVSSPPMENARLELANGRIIAVESGRDSSGQTIDLGDAVVMPGLVNAHTHLELTFFRGRVPRRGTLVDWIRDLAALQHSAAVGDASAAIADGLRQSRAAGVVAVADIGHGRAAVEAWRSAPLLVAGFLEVLGLGPRLRQNHERSLAAASAILEESTGSLPVPPGLEPHAPYSTDPSLYRDAIALCRDTHRPICTHLAETLEEVQFLADATGPFRALLEEWGLWDGSFEAPGCSPVEYADRLGLLSRRPLLAHVNYASDHDIDLLAAGGASVAYCPRTHAFFGHSSHRYADMLAHGVNVCIGTDSLAGNDSLSVMDELRFLRRQNPPVSDQQLLALATSAGAWALGLTAEIGALAPGRRANFIVVPLDNPTTHEPLADVLTGVQPVQASHLAADRTIE